MSRQLTEFHRPPSKPESREHHLAQPKGWTKTREEAHGHNTEEVEKETDQNGINEAQTECRLPKNANGEGADNHVCGQPLGLVSGKGL